MNNKKPSGRVAAAVGAMDLFTRRSSIVWKKLLLSSGLILILSSLTQGQTKIEIIDPNPHYSPSPVYGSIEVTVKTTETMKIRVKVDGEVDNAKQDLDLKGTGEHVILIGLFPGKNEIKIIGFKDDRADKVEAYIPPVECKGLRCDGQLASELKKPSASGATQAGQNPQNPSKTDDKKTKIIEIESPKDSNFFRSAVIPLNVTVSEKPNTTPPDPKLKQIEKVSIIVLNEGNQIPQDANPLKVEFKDGKAKLSTSIKIGKGTNTITVVDAAGKSMATADQASVQVERVDNQGSIEIESPKGSNVFRTAVIPLKVTVSKRDDSKDKSVKQIEKVSIIVLNEGNQVLQDANSLTIDFKSGKEANLSTNIRLGKGTNIITVVDSAAKTLAEADQASVQVERVDNLDNKGTVTINKPNTGDRFQDATVIPLKVTVSKREGAGATQVKKVFVRVLNQGKPIEPADNPVDVKFDGDKAVKADVEAKIRIGKGKNKITVFDADKEDDQDSIEINCEGDDCGSGLLVATIPSNSRNTRVVAGMEQVGASSASSQTNPFLDLFFNGPLRFHLRKDCDKDDKKDCKKDDEAPQLAQVSTWGQIRLSTTPEQIGAVGAFPSNLVNSVSQAGKTTDLIQSFDFLAGMDFKLFSSNGVFPSLIPGVNQKTVVYFAGGFGAISPLSSRKEQAQIYQVPVAGSLQRKLFDERFPEAAANADAKYIAFVFPERDRFLKQWYVGFRVKTFHCEDPDCKHLANRFPGVFDLMFGQNEAVTGGRWDSDVTDDNGKLLGRKSAYVFRFDGTFPLPIKQASFLYLYGSAMMKMGGGGVKITTPLFLDAAPGDVLVTNKSVFVTPTLQLDRDYYKIGVGVNLSDLFNRKTPKQ